MSESESLRRSVVRLFSAVWEKLVDLEIRVAAMEERQKALPLGYSRLSLSELIAQHFDVPEIDGIAFVMGLDYDHIAGQTREERTRSLIAYCERRSCVHELLIECQRQRPSVMWPRVPVD